MDYFDYRSVAREAGIPPGSLAQMEALARRDYPGDQMIFGLRMLRTCNAVKQGLASVDDVLRSEPRAA